MPTNKTSNRSSSDDNDADRNSPPERRGFLSALLGPPRSQTDHDTDEGTRPSRAPTKWRAVLLGTGTMLLGSVLLQLAMTPVATKSRLIAFQPTSGEVRSSVPGGRGPAGVAYGADGRRVWVANAFADEIVPYSDEGTRSADPIRVGKAPVALAVDSATGRLVVANSGSNDISIVDPVNATVTGTVGAGDNPAGVAIAPISRRAYVSNLKSGDVTVVDLDSRIVVARIPVGKDPQSLAVSGPQETLFVAAAGDNEVKAIDTATGAISGTVSTSSAPIAIAAAPGGIIVAAGYQERQAIIIDTSAMAVTKTIQLPSRPNAVAVDPVGGGVTIVSSEAREAYVLDLPTATVATTTALGITASSVTAGADEGVLFAYGLVPVPAAVNILYIAGLMAFIALGGFVAGRVSRQEPVRHSIFALGGLALLIWLLLAGGRIEALIAVVFSAAFALPAAALGGFIAGRRTGVIENDLRTAITGAIRGRQAGANEGSSTSDSPSDTDDERLDDSEAPRRKRRRYRPIVDSRDSDETLD